MQRTTTTIFSRTSQRRCAARWPATAPAPLSPARLSARWPLVWYLQKAPPGSFGPSHPVWGMADGGCARFGGPRLHHCTTCCGLACTCRQACDMDGPLCGGSNAQKHMYAQSQVPRCVEMLRSLHAASAGTAASRHCLRLFTGATSLNLGLRTLQRCPPCGIHPRRRWGRGRCWC